MTRARIVVGMVLCIASARLASGQSLAVLAQQEVQRRQAMAAPARVIRTGDLRSQARFSVMGVLSTIADVPGIGASSRRVPVSPARLLSGALPQIPVLSVSGGEVLLEVSVDPEGRTSGVRVLRHTPAFTESMVAAVAGWRFEPAEDAAAPAAGEPIDPGTRQAIASKVLVVAQFRPPALYPMTLGEPPMTIAPPSDAVPALAVFPAMPASPPRALFDGVVLTELRVGEEGVSSARIMRSSPGLAGPVLDALNGLTFRPARVHGVPTSAMVYAITAFRQPVTQ